VERLFEIITHDPGLQYHEYEGKFLRAYCVKQRTFESYVRALRLEGRIIFDDEKEVFWTPATWAAEGERKKQMEAQVEMIRVRASAGKLEQFFDQPRE
jgi:hypothetical protein